MKLEIDLARTIQENAGKIRIGLAALAGLSGLGGAGIPDLLRAIAESSKPAIVSVFEPSKAYADDLLKPPIFQGRDGRNVTIAPFEKAGRAYIFTGESGLEVFNAANGLDAPGGVVYGGKSKLIVVSNSSAMNIGVRALNCGEGLYIDVIDNVGGNGYMERAPNAMAILEQEMNRVPAQERGEYSYIGQIGVEDVLRNQVFDLIGGSVDRGIRSEPKGCGGPTVLISPAPVVLQPVQEAAPVPSGEACVGIAESVPGTHGAVPIANLDASAPQGVWIRPVYNQAKADAAHNWEGIGPWAPISFASEPGAAHLKTFGNLGEFIIVGDAGGKVWLGVWQEAQHQNETKMRPDGTLNPAWQNQYTIDGLPAGAVVIPFDPDTGKQLTWPDGTPIVWAAGPLGTFSMGLPAGEVRAGVCFTIPGQIPGVQKPEIKVFRGPNDQPGLTGENQLPNTPQVVKPGMPD